MTVLLFDFLKIGDDSKNVILSLLSNFIWLVAGLLILWARRNVYHYLIAKRTIVAFFSRRKYILIWNDDTLDVSSKIMERLQTKGLKNYRYKLLKEPKELLYYPANSKHVQLILLIVTDVTKLSEDLKKRNEIQEKLKLYVNRGGVLIGTHDLIYRRCRNNVLQALFGCEIIHFERHVRPIKVEVNKTFEKHPLLRGVPKTFELPDGEVTTGNWESDVDALIHTCENCFKDSMNACMPLVCLRKTPFDGVVIWLSSGDKGSDTEHAKSLDQPEFLQMLYNSIAYATEIKQFKKQAAGGDDSKS